MNIGFDAKRLYCNFTGLGNYSRTLLKNLEVADTINQYSLYTPKIIPSPETGYFSKSKLLKTKLPTSFPKWYWRSYGIKNQLKKDGIEIFHGLSNEIPIGIEKTAIKSVVTIHDLIFKKLPDTFPLYQSCNSIFYTPIESKNSDYFFKQNNIPENYLLFVGSIEERKNIYNIVAAYKHLPSESQIPLVIVGRRADKNYKRKVVKLIAELKLDKQVIWLDKVFDNFLLKELYSRAEMLIYPSFYEGFGLPVVEALLCNTPVITSDTSSLREAGGPNS